MCWFPPRCVLLKDGGCAFLPVREIRAFAVCLRLAGPSNLLVFNFCCMDKLCVSGMELLVQEVFTTFLKSFCAS